VSEMDAVRAKLVEKFEGPESLTLTYDQARMLVHLICWTEDNPTSTRAEYLDEMKRTRQVQAWS
jgi:hypothetical protein